MSFLEVFNAFEADQIDAEEALALSGCFDLLDLYEMAADFAELDYRESATA